MKVTISNKTEILIQDKTRKCIKRFFPSSVASETDRFGKKLLIIRE